MKLDFGSFLASPDPFCCLFCPSQVLPPCASHSCLNEETGKEEGGESGAEGILERSLPTEDHMQISDRCLDSPQMGCSGLWSLNRAKDHDMYDNSRNKEWCVVRRVMCVYLRESARECCIGTVAHTNCKESWLIWGISSKSKCLKSALVSTIKGYSDFLFQI